MQIAEVVLGVLRERGRKGLPFTQLYRQMFNKELYLLAYGNIYSNQGAMTPGASAETADGMSEGKIDQIIEAMRHERYRFSPARRVYIPKKNGKLRPLGLPPWSDKLVGEVVRLLLEAIYEPRFSGRSHGFRKGRGCHTALREIRETWTGTTWFIEGDISDCYGSFDHEILLGILAEKIHDQRFLRLIRHMLKAGYLEDWDHHDTLSGVPQGGVVTPPTLWATRAMVALRVGVAGLRVFGGGAFPEGDAVSDGDLLGSYEDVFDEQAQDVLALLDGGSGGVAAYFGEEAFHVGGEFEVDLAVGELGVDCVELSAQVRLAGTQVGHSGAELLECDQLLGERPDHGGDRGGGLGQRGLQMGALPGGGIGGARVVESFVDLGADQGRVGEQGGDVIPHELVEVVGADRFVGADPTAFVAVVVAAQAPVVVDLFVGGAG
jgi:hypothetical protein